MTQLTFWNSVPLPPESHPPDGESSAGDRTPTTAYLKASGRILPLKELPEKEQPVNRLHGYGPAALSTIELLAILLGNSHQLHDASALLAAFDGLTGLARAPIAELQRRPGVGTATAARIQAAFELGRRLMTETAADRPQVRSPADAAHLVMPEMMTLEQEHLKVLLLDTKNRVMRLITLYVGSLNTSLIRVGEVFRDAIRANAAAVIVCHNHPSGDPTPSPEDVAVTRQIVAAGKLIDIEVMDHLIIGSGFRWVSLKERGLGFSS